MGNLFDKYGSCSNGKLQREGFIMQLFCDLDPFFM